MTVNAVVVVAVAVETVTVVVTVASTADVMLRVVRRVHLEALSPNCRFYWIKAF
jgi:hypothetical protein